MSTVVVTTQAQLDQAIADGVATVEIRSDAGVWLELHSSGSSSVVARGSSSVVARGSSSVVARESSSVVARESSSVEAWGSSSVVAWESSSVVAWGSSSVEAWGSSSVVAWGATSVTARDNAKVNAGSRTAVHLHSGHVALEGGVLIDHTQVDQTDPAIWCECNGVQVTDGAAVLYKAVGEDWRSLRGTSYEPGTTATCDDFADTNACGAGLHFGPTPGHAADYFREAARFVECHVQLDGLQPITGGTAKCKAASAVCVREVDRWMDPVGESS